jgi:hypothetical protein
MSVIFPRDRAYQRARKVRQGRMLLPNRFDGFIAEFTSNCNVTPLWLECDHIDRTHDPFPKPRLEIVIEHPDDYRKFLTAP